MSRTTWKEVKGFPNYQINKQGQIKSLRQPANNSILSPFTNNSGYEQVRLFDPDGERRHPLVHRLVALTFLNRPSHCTQVDHLDGNKHNNAISNLEWVTPLENRRRYLRTRNKQ